MDPDLADQYTRAASNIDRVLKGAKSNDPPIQAPPKFEIAINPKPPIEGGREAEHFCALQA